MAFSAFGIGVEYDHEFLAQLCGGRTRVEHLETSVEAARAFERFLALEGRTVTSRTALRFRTAPGVQLSSVTLLRGPRAVTPVGDEVAIDDLIPGQPATALLEFDFRPASPGVALLANVSLDCDFPGYRLSDQAVSRRIDVKVSNDPMTVNVPNPGVVKILQIVQNAMALASAAVDLKCGNIRGATDKLQKTEGRLIDEGKHEEAAAVGRLTAQLQQETDHNKSVKQGLAGDPGASGQQLTSRI